MSAVALFGAGPVTAMMIMYALESRGRGFILAFAAGCLLSTCGRFQEATCRGA